MPQASLADLGQTFVSICQSAKLRQHESPSMQGKYSVELFHVGGEGKGIEAILCRRNDLTTARASITDHWLRS
jgi:hypothetical protein